MDELRTHHEECLEKVDDEIGQQIVHDADIVGEAIQNAPDRRCIEETTGWRKHQNASWRSENSAPDWSANQRGQHAVVQLFAARDQDAEQEQTPAGQHSRFTANA